MSGFVYIWFDRKHKRYYVGSHWGYPNDGYICSSNWMRDAYRRRPQDFKRRIIKIITTSRLDLLEEEHRYLDMIKDKELRIRYYNLSKKHFGHWATNLVSYKSVSEKMKGNQNGKGKVCSLEKRKKIADAQRGKIITDEAKKLMSISKKGRHWYTNQIENRMVHECPGPEWIIGRCGVIGHEHTNKTKQQISKTKRMRNYRHTFETRQKCGAKNIGRTPWNKGMKYTFKELSL